MRQYQPVPNEVRKVLRGNIDAENFIQTLGNIAHVWDDLIDKDRTPTDEEINHCFWQALVELPRNRFYQAHFQELQPLVCIAIQNWMAANTLEKEKRSGDLEIAFIIRSSYINIVIHSALLLGGYEWAKAVTPDLRRFWHDEGFQQYVTNTG
jgi:hypothetical protein